MDKGTNSKMITLRSNDGEEFIMSETAAMQSQVIRYMIEDDCCHDPIPLPNVAAKILAKVIEFCNKQVKAADALNTDMNEEGTRIMRDSSKMSDEELSKWEKQFLDVDQETLFELILATDYLCINKLFNLTCQKVADMMKGKTPEEIRRTFHIINDYTPEEEKEIRHENQWAFV